MPVELLITPGDIAGIGPEVALKAAVKFQEELEDCEADQRPLLTFVGPEHFWRHEAEQLDLPAPESFLTTPEIGQALPENYEKGQLSAECGRFAMVCLEQAARYARQRQHVALVTAPLNKEGIRLAGYKAAGHTDFLAGITGTENYAMAFATPSFKVVLVTHHLPLKDVSRNLSAPAVLEKIIQADKMAKALSDNREAKPRVAVCGLNPHAGENGLLGNEDQTVIAPAVEDAVLLGVDAWGPLPSDSVFHFALQGKYDIVVAMYHDQGLIPVKLLDFDAGVNVTLGLPFPRTSPDHGTAYGIARNQIANPGSMLAALRLARRLAE